MRAIDIIHKKRQGSVLTKEEIDFIVLGFTKGEIPDYQMSAFLMAVFFRGMTDEETTDLTLSMVHSGEVVDLSGISGIKIDKHSTGGIGDTTTLVLAPLVAACGAKLAKMSGRGLGVTGGTLDKMESIPGLSVDLNKKEFIDQVNKIGVAVISQTQNLAPADKKIYALRDVTATVENVSLIASSIMSKKIASGADGIVLDVKTGSGAFMKTLESSRKLAEVMIGIGRLAKKKVVALITNMDEPLGSHIGNTLEVKEAIEILTGEIKDTPLVKLSLKLGAYLLKLAEKAESVEEGYKMMEKALNTGAGAEKFKEMIKAQKGDPKVVDNVNLLPQPKIKEKVTSSDSGYVFEINAEKIGLASVLLGAGRSKKEDKIDSSVGLIMHKRVGDKVEKSEALAEIWANDNNKLQVAKKHILEAMNIRKEKPDLIKPLIYEVIEG